MPRDPTGMAVRVSTFETEFDLKLKHSATAKNLFDTIVSTTGIREVLKC